MVGTSVARNSSACADAPAGEPPNRIALASSAAAVASGPCTIVVISLARRRWPSRRNGASAVRGRDRVALVDRQQRELEQEALDVGVRDVHPVLEELVGRRAVGRQPDRAVLGLAELLAVGAEQAAAR